MPTPVLVPNALVQLATVEGELGLTVGTVPATDTAIARIIAAATASIEQWCSRSFYWAQRVEAYGTPGGPRPGRLFPLNNAPVYPPVASSIVSVVVNLDPGTFQGETETLEAGEDYYFEDSARGFIFRQVRWPSTALRRPDITQDWDPDAVELTTQVTYFGGYVTPTQMDQALTTWPTGTTPAAGTLLIPSGHTSHLWAATTSGAVGGSEPSWPASPTLYQTVTDGAAVWTFLGYNSSVSTLPQARTLPYDVEQAAIDTAVTWYRRRGEGLEALNDKFGDASKGYGDARLGLPSTAVALLRPYRKIVVA